MKHIVCFHVYNDYSGSPKVLQMVLQGLLQKGYAVDMVTSRSHGALDSLDGMEGFRKSTYSYRFYEKHLFRTFLNYLWSQVYMFFFALKYAFRKDVVFYVNTILPFGAALAGRLIGKRVVYHYHENAFAKGFHYRVNARIMTLLANEIICVSAYQASFLKRKTGVTVIPNALPEEFVSRFHLDTEAAFNRRNILMLSSLKEYKGTREFIKMAVEMPAYSFTLVINDSQENIRRYLWENKISVPGNLVIYPRQKDVAPFYNEASVVVNLSNKHKAIETFGLTVLEAFSAGLPVIVPTVGGIAGLVDEQTGFKIDVQDLSKIENAITKLLSDKAFYCRLSKNALEKSKEYEKSAVVSKVRSIIDERQSISSLFLELVRISVGNQDAFTQVPTAWEWKMMFSMAKTQCLVGVCFVGVQKIAAADKSSTGRKQGPPRQLYVKWVFWAARIQETYNEHLYAQTLVSDHLCGKHFRTVFMKGLICAARYPQPQFRQCGDIDFVVRMDDFNDVMRAIEEIADVNHNLKHEHHGIATIGSVQLEPHYKMHNYQNPFTDRMMRQLQDSLFNSSERHFVHIGDMEFETLPVEIEGMYLVSHMVNHVYAEGLGLRQVLDFGLWLKSLPDNNRFDLNLYHAYLKQMHWTRAARIFTLVCENYLGIDKDIMCYSYTAREKRFARKMVADVIAVGNFARGAKGSIKAGWKAYIWTVKRVWKLGYLCPSEARWWPLSKFARFFDKQLNSNKYTH